MTSVDLYTSQRRVFNGDRLVATFVEVGFRPFPAYRFTGINDLLNAIDASGEEPSHRVEADGPTIQVVRRGGLELLVISHAPHFDQGYEAEEVWAKHRYLALRLVPLADAAPEPSREPLAIAPASGFAVFPFLEDGGDLE